ncbi:Protein nud1, partial [Coemansia sp. S610]
ITSRLEAISLAGNKLQGLHGLPPGLVSLRAPSNWIRFSASDPVRFSFARELPHLEEIDLSANEISDIAVFSGLRHLRTLELTRNRIYSLSGLRGCRRLAYLGLRDNIVTDFDLDAAEAPMLATLDVFNNRLRVVPASIADFAYLAKANFVKNDLEKVEVHGSPAESLRELRLSENPLLVRKSGGVVDMALWRAKFPGLKTLYLDICNIRQLAQSSGEGVWPSVFNLSLRGNSLHPSLALDFSCLCHLKNLYAPDTQMVLPRVLPPLNNLLQLVLCNAGLAQLPDNMGAALPQLRLLDVSNNLELVDLTPILQLSSSLEVLKCRAIGFGLALHDTGNLTPVTPAIAKWTPGVETFPGQDGGALEECAMLRRLAGLRRLRRLDLRFNRCTIELYAPPPPAASALDSVLSPQIPSTSVMGESGLPSASPMSGGASACRFDEESWIRQDQAHVASLKLTRQTGLIQRRDNYWGLAVALFPRLEELDGIKAGSR